VTSKDSLLDSKIGGCLLLEKLGEGGMGTVYLARQLSLDRVVALKILSPNFAKDKEKRERFLKEAKASAKLHHPNIISIHSAGYDGGHCYYAMEYIEGGSVKEIIARDGKIPEDRALEIIYEISQALQHAFQKKLIHRDVKPDNFMITKEGGIKLCDLGLAKILEDDPHMTQEGVFMGTPYYTSPEQAKGSKEVDIRSDLYSLGASLFYMISGHHPFEGSNPISIITMHINDQPPLVSKYAPNISKGTIQLIDKLLKKDPLDRFQTPAEVMEAIIDILKRHHKKNKTLRISQQMPVYEKEESVSLNFIKPIAITIGVIIIAYIGFSLMKSKPKKVEVEPVQKLTSGLGESFNLDKNKFLELMRKPEISSLTKRDRFKEISDIYLNALPNEVNSLKDELEAFLDVTAVQSTNIFFDKSIALAKKDFSENKFGNGYQILLSIIDTKVNIGLLDLSVNNKSAYLGKAKQSRNDYLNKIVENILPIKNNEDNMQINQLRNHLAKAKEFEEILFVLNKAVQDYNSKLKSQVEKTPNNENAMPEAKEIAKTDETNSGLSKELLDLSNRMKQNIKDKKFVELLRNYVGNRDKIKINDNDKLMAKEFPDTYCAAESIEKLYSNFSRNMRRLMEGEEFVLENVKYTIVKVTPDSIGLMTDKKDLIEIPFDKLPVQVLYDYSTALRDFDQGLKLSMGVYTLLKGDKNKGNEIINSVDDATKSRFVEGLQILQK
jgi:hypothetical protein